MKLLLCCSKKSFKKEMFKENSFFLLTQTGKHTLLFCNWVLNDQQNLNRKRADLQIISVKTFFLITPEVYSLVGGRNILNGIEIKLIWTASYETYLSLLLLLLYKFIMHTMIDRKVESEVQMWCIALTLYFLWRGRGGFLIICFRVSFVVVVLCS